MDLEYLQYQVFKLYNERGYHASPQTLVLGTMEELGELAEAILLTECNDFVPSPKKLFNTYDLAHEIGDIIIYLLALCNVLEIKPTFEWMDEHAGD